MGDTNEGHAKDIEGDSVGNFIVVAPNNVAWLLSQRKGTTLLGSGEWRSGGRSLWKDKKYIDMLFTDPKDSRTASIFVTSASRRSTPD